MHEIKHLSPSSMKDWKRCPHRFKLMRLEGEKVPRVTTLNQDVGTVFDAHVKVRLNRRLQLAEMLKEVKNEKAIEIGAHLATIYDRTGALQALIDEGVGQVEIDKEFLINGVPVYGKPDYTMYDGAIGDWKTSLSGSPKPGYKTLRRWLLHLGQPGPIEGPHERSDEPLNRIDDDWAFQLTIYAFLMGHKPGKQLRARIEHTVAQANSIVIASYNSYIEADFQEYCYELPKEIWGQIKSMQIPLPMYDERKCTMYGKLCEVASQCDAYKAEGGVSSTENPGILLGDMK